MIDGVSLCNAIRACILQTEKGYSSDEMGITSSLEYRKWELLGQTETTDMITFDLGPLKHSFASVKRSTNPNMHYMIAVGKDPTIAVFSASDVR